MVLEILSSEVGSLLLFLLLIAAFVVAFKIMQMVFETILVSVISAGFYLSLVYLFNYSFTLERLLLFAFLGATLYMAYSFLVSAYGIVSTLLEIPYRILKPLIQLPIRGLKKLYSYVKEKYSLYKKKSKDGDDSYKGYKESGGGNDDDEDDGGESPGENDVKEVVLDKVKRD